MSDSSTNLLIVQSSLHAKSTTAAMCRFVDSHAQSLGANVTYIDLREFDLPIFDPQTGRDTEGYKKLVGPVNDAHAFLLGTPDYHGGPSAGIKNFLDYFWTEFTGKLFGYVCASHEKGLTVMDALRTAVRQCYGWSLPYGVAAIEKTEVEPEGEIIDERVKNRLIMLSHDLVRYGKVLSDTRAEDIAHSDPTFLANLRS
ncbi:MAG: NAD(P)H-dependent oxidoreductase [Verrucomicrobiota bacterium]